MVLAWAAVAAVVAVTVPMRAEPKIACELPNRFVAVSLMS